MDRLLELQNRIASRIDSDPYASGFERLTVRTVHNQKYVTYYGDYLGESFADLLDTVAEASVAESFASLEMSGPDGGANGTRNWDLSKIANCSVAFPNLLLLSIEQTKATDHNRSIVAESYEEDGVLAKILAKAPRLESLTTPSAPNSDFFSVVSHPIRHLNIDTGYDHQGFIANLTHSRCFPNLQIFEFGEYNETYMEDFSAGVTPFADYRELFASPAFESVNVFLWKNPVCTAEQLAELKELKPDRQISIVRWTSYSDATGCGRVNKRLGVSP